MHIFLHLLLPLCSLPAAVWLCAGFPDAFGLGVRMTPGRINPVWGGGLREKRKVSKGQEMGSKVKDNARGGRQMRVDDLLGHRKSKMRVDLEKTNLLQVVYIQHERK